MTVPPSRMHSATYVSPTASDGATAWPVVWAATR